MEGVRINQEISEIFQPQLDNSDLRTAGQDSLLPNESQLQLISNSHLSSFLLDTPAFSHTWRFSQNNVLILKHYAIPRGSRLALQVVQVPNTNTSPGNLGSILKSGHCEEFCMSFLCPSLHFFIRFRLINISVMARD